MAARFLAVLAFIAVGATSERARVVRDVVWGGAASAQEAAPRRAAALRCRPRPTPPLCPAGAHGQVLKAESALDAVQAVPYLSTLLAAVQAANLTDALGPGFNGTLIAPQDAVRGAERIAGERGGTGGGRRRRRGGGGEGVVGRGEDWNKPWPRTPDGLATRASGLPQCTGSSGGAAAAQRPLRPRGSLTLHPPGTRPGLCQPDAAAGPLVTGRPAGAGAQRHAAADPAVPRHPGGPHQAQRAAGAIDTVSIAGARAHALCPRPRFSQPAGIVDEAGARRPMEASHGRASTAGRGAWGALKPQ